jgi:hypothetical protein
VAEGSVSGVANTGKIDETIPVGVRLAHAAVGWPAERACLRGIQWTRFATTTQRRDVFAIPTSLADDPAALQQMLRAALAEIERQRLIIAALQRSRFGRRSEKLDEATIQHGVEDLEQSVAEQSAALEAAASSSAPRKATAAPNVSSAL